MGVTLYCFAEALISKPFVALIMGKHIRKGMSKKTLSLIRPYLHLWTGSDMDFARILAEENYTHEISLHSWANHVSRFRKFYPDEIKLKIEEKVYEENISEYISEKPYYYNDETDVYVTFLRSAGGKPITVSGDTHRAMKEAYSSMVAEPATINEIGRTFQFPRAWFDEYRRTHGWTHDMDPFTNEEMENADVEDLVDELVLRNRRALHITYEKRKWDDI